MGKSRRGPFSSSLVSRGACLPPDLFVVGCPLGRFRRPFFVYVTAFYYAHFYTVNHILVVISKVGGVVGLVGAMRWGVSATDRTPRWLTTVGIATLTRGGLLFSRQWPQ